MDKERMVIDYPNWWDVVKDWQAVLPPSPLRIQDDSNQCWSLSVADCVKDVAYLEKNSLPDEISNSEMRDWLPYMKIFFNMMENPTVHAVNSTMWPAYDEINGCGASMPYIFQYLRCFGTHFKKNYNYYEQPLLANNFTMFSMEKFHRIRRSAPKRVFINTFRLLDSKTAIPVVMKNHPVVGILFSSYPEFKDYNFCEGLSPIRPIDEKTKLPHPPDHMVYIVGYGFVKKGEERTECFLVKNTWGDDWGIHGLAMVPVTLFSHVGYPKGVTVRDSHIIIENDYHLEDTFNKIHGMHK